jgi:hypothetical protein
MASDITREQWEEETERLCPSGQAYHAYVDLEQFIVEATDLNVTYQKVARGKTDYATFLATAGDKCSIAQVYKGKCQLNWKLKSKVPGISDEQREQIDQAYEEFRVALDGQERLGNRSRPSTGRRRGATGRQENC